jgi:hypothetical protein
MIEQIYFSLYKEVPDYSVRIFKSAHWVLGNGVKLEVDIIGKSHRVISRRGEICLTELITCFDQELPDQALEKVKLLPSIVHDRKYLFGNLAYRVNVEYASRVFNTMEEFTSSLGGVSETLTHVFMSSPWHSDSSLPFTGLALNSDTNTFYTVHTYPERNISIISRTAIDLSVLSPTT